MNFIFVFLEICRMAESVLFDIFDQDEPNAIVELPTTTSSMYVQLNQNLQRRGMFIYAILIGKKPMVIQTPRINVYGKMTMRIMMNQISIQNVLELIN